MAGLIGSTAWFALAKQSGKGTAATNAKHAYPFAGGSIQPKRETDNLQETDSQRDMGVTYVQSQGTEGNPEFYVRDASIPLPLVGALGAVATTGTNPNYTHTITPSNALPYLTGWRMLGNTLYERFTDLMVNELTVKASAGGPLTATMSVMGLKGERLTSDPMPGWTPTVTLDSGPVYNYNEATVTLGGSATALISSFELSISNSLKLQQTDDVTPYDVVPGTREVNLSFDLIFENLTEYNQFQYGSGSGTQPSATLYTTSADFLFSKGANNSVQFTLPSIAYEEFPVEPQPDGSPVTVSVRAQAQRGGSPVVTAVVKNQNSAAA